jgi:uncharacterized protein HemX
MASNVNIRSYRLQQASLKAGRRKVFLSKISISSEAQKVMAIMVAIALITGLAITQFFHGHIVKTKNSVMQLQSKNAVVGNENMRLLATRAQLASKTKIVSLARVKLHLFEPEKGQVHRM